jgi:hypothetical protein
MNASHLNIDSREPSLGGRFPQVFAPWRALGS